MAKKPAPRRPRTPDELTLAEVRNFFGGLRQFLYESPDEEGEGTHWEPDASVQGSELVAWIAEEMTRLRLVPLAGPVDYEGAP